MQAVGGSEIPKAAAAEAGVVGLETWVNVERFERFDSAISRRAEIAANAGAATCGKQMHPEDKAVIVVVAVAGVAAAAAAAAAAAPAAADAAVPAAAAAAGAPAPPLPASEEEAVHALAAAAVVE